MLRLVRSFLNGLALLRHGECREGLIELIADVRLRRQIMQQHPGTVIEKGAIILGYNADRLIANRVRVCSGTVLSFGDDVTGFGSITIGANTWIGQSNNIRASEAAHIEIGSDCLISQFCSLVSANHLSRAGQLIRLQKLSSERIGVTLGNDVWLGAGVSVLPGVRIGNSAIIGAGAVVTKHVPDNEIWAGVPAEKISVRR